MTATDWQLLLQRASGLRRAGRLHEAIAAYEQLLKANPALPESWYNLAWLQRQARQFEPALESYREALARGVSDPQEVHLNRAVILADELHRSDEAEAELRAALAIDPHYVPALVNLGNLHEDRGDRCAASDAYERAVRADPENVLALARLAGVSDAHDAEPILARLRAALERPGITAGDRADLGFALGRLLDSIGEYDGAFEAYAAANAASRASCGPGFRGYDAAAHERLVDRLIAAFPSPAPQQGPPPTPEPLFICGMFRSGSTLVEQILAGHAAIAAGGELNALPAMIADKLQPYPEAAAAAHDARLEELRAGYLKELARVSTGRPIVTDKRPDNFLHVGLIKRLFPKARIVHTRRNPLDNCLSLYFLHLDPAMAYALDLADAGHWYRQYERLMAHWKRLYPDDIFDVDYDALVENAEPLLRELMEFLGLDWDERCLDFHKAQRVVKTASVWQVREPLHGRSSGRWRNYERHLGALRGMLRE